jgi:rod shape-determining protein MreB
MTSKTMGQQIKMTIGSACPLGERLTMEVKGRHLTEGRPTTVTMDDAEIRKAIAEPIRSIVQAVHHALERIPPELSADIIDRGIILTGGGALLKNMDQRLREETGLSVLLAEDPLSSVVLGGRCTFPDFKLLRVGFDGLNSAVNLPPCPATPVILGQWTILARSNGARGGVTIG